MRKTLAPVPGPRRRRPRRVVSAELSVHRPNRPRLRRRRARVSHPVEARIHHHPLLFSLSLSLHFSTLSTPIGDCRRDEVDRKKAGRPSVAASAWEVRRRRAKQILGLLLRPLRAALLLPTSLGGSGRRSIREQLLPRVPGIGYYLVIRFETRDDPGQGGKSHLNLLKRNETSAPTKIEHLVTFYLGPAGAREFFFGISMHTRRPRT